MPLTVRSLAAPMATVFLLAGVVADRTEAQAPIVEKSIVSCPDPCSQDVLGAPGVTTVRYKIFIQNTDPVNNLQLNLKDDIPPGAVAFRVVDKGNTQPCPGARGPTCANVQAPGGANGTGQVVLQNLVVARASSPKPTVTVLVDVDFSCPPVTQGEVIANQAEITSIIPTGLCAPCRTNSVTFIASCLPPPDYTVTKTVQPTEWTTGDPTLFTYTITIENGSATAPLSGASLELIDDLPQSLRGLAYDPLTTCPIQVNSVPPAMLNVDPSGCLVAGTLGVTGFPDLPPGGKITLTFSITLRDDDHPDGSKVCNSVRVDRSGVPGPRAQACTNIHDPLPVDFRRSVKTVTPDPAAPGDELTYTLAITNTGKTAASNARVTDPFPSCVDTALFLPSRDVTVVPGPTLATFDFPSRTLMVTLGTVSPGETRTITVKGVRAGLTLGGCCNQGRVDSDEATDHRTGPTAGSETPTCIEIKPDFVDFSQSTKSVEPSPAEQGGPLTYTFFVTNTGNDTATNVTVYDQLAPCLDVSGFDPAVDVTADPGPIAGVAFNGASRVLTIDFAAIAPAAPQTVTVGGLAAATVTPACCNQASIFSDQLPSPGQQTGSTPGGGNPTCVQVGVGGCGLLRRRATSPVKTGPWLYTTDCGSGDVRLTGPDFIRPVPRDLDIEPIQPAAGFELTLYQLDCSCADEIAIIRNAAVTPPAIHLRY